MSRSEVSLEQRQADYQEAETRAVTASEGYLDARAAGRMTGPAFGEMDEAQAGLRRAKRRLEGTERRLAKKEAAA